MAPPALRYEEQVMISHFLFSDSLYYIPKEAGALREEEAG
jgi:hypothetical protein